MGVIKSQHAIVRTGILMRDFRRLGNCLIIGVLIDISNLFVTSFAFLKSFFTFVELIKIFHYEQI